MIKREKLYICGLYPLAACDNQKSINNHYFDICEGSTGNPHVKKCPYREEGEVLRKVK